MKQSYSYNWYYYNYKFILLPKSIYRTDNSNCPLRYKNQNPHPLYVTKKNVGKKKAD